MRLFACSFLNIWALGVPSFNGYFELCYVAVRTCVLYHAESLEFGETNFDMQFQIKYHKWPMCTWEISVFSIYWVQSTTWFYYIKSIILLFRSLIILENFDCMIYSFLKSSLFWLWICQLLLILSNYIFWVCTVSCIQT